MGEGNDDCAWSAGLYVVGPGPVVMTIDTAFRIADRSLEESDSSHQFRWFDR